MIKRGAFQSAYFIFGFLLFLARCTGTSGISELGGDSLSGDTTSGTTDSSGDTDSSSGSSEESGSSGSSGEGEAVPGVSFPGPTLRIDESKAVLAAVDPADDGVHYLPWVFYPDSVVPDSGTLTDLDTDGDGIVNNMRVAVSLAAITDTSTPVCEQTGIACCDILTDGSSACYLPDGTNDMTLYAQVVDTSANTVGSAIEATPNTNFLFLATAPKSLVATKTVSGTDATYPLWSLTDGIGVGIDFADGVFEVMGNFTENYLNFEASGDQLDYDPNTNYFGTRNSTEGIYLYEFDGRTAEYKCTRTDDDAEEYTFVKRTSDGQLRFGAKFTTATGATYLLNALDDSVSADGSTCDPDPSSDERIQFLNSDFAVDGITELKAKSIIAADVDDNSTPTAIVVFEDDSGTYRVRMSNPTIRTGGARKGGESALTGSYDFKDLVIYQSQNGTDPTTNAGKYLLLDAHNNTVWVGTYFVDPASPFTDDSITDTLDSSTSAVTVGTNPSSIVLNDDKTVAYVLNADDNTISVLPLKDSSGTVKSVSEIQSGIQTINLTDYLSGKDITLTPNELTYYASGDSKYVIAGLSGAKAALTIDVVSIESTATASSSDSTTKKKKKRGSSLIPSFLGR